MILCQTLMFQALYTYVEFRNVKPIDYSYQHSKKIILHNRIFLSYIMEKDQKEAKNEKRTKRMFPEKNSCHAACPFADVDTVVRLREI